MRIATLALLMLAPAQRLVAQICGPGPSSNEAKTLAIFSVPLAFSPALAPETRPQFQVGLEGAYLPKAYRARATGLVGSLRVHSTFGSIYGPITCDDAPSPTP